MNQLRNAIDRLPVDNKLVVAGATYLLTLAVTRVGLDLGEPLIPGYLTVAQAIALAAAAIAGYVQPNTATVLAGDHEDGNPSAPDTA